MISESNERSLQIRYYPSLIYLRLTYYFILNHNKSLDPMVPFALSCYFPPPGSEDDIRIGGWRIACRLRSDASSVLVLAMHFGSLVRY